jgi:hypothetical protein
MLSKMGDGMVPGLMLAPLGFLLGAVIVIALGIMIPVWILQLLSAWI